MEFPETLTELEKELGTHALDGRSDAPFRLAIAVDQLGSLARHLTHDPVENPITRPFGTKDGEIADAGHAIVQLMTYCTLRGIPLQRAVNMALVNLREKDFIKRERSHNDVSRISGRVACYIADANGRAWVDPHCEALHAMPSGSILVAIHPTSAIAPFVGKLAGIITDEGGMGCHAAIISREFKIPCIVGTVIATQQIKTGDIIRIAEGQVYRE